MLLLVCSVLGILVGFALGMLPLINHYMPKKLSEAEKRGRDLVTLLEIKKKILEAAKSGEYKLPCYTDDLSPIVKEALKLDGYELWSRAHISWTSVCNADLEGHKMAILADEAYRKTQRELTNNATKLLELSKQNELDEKI
jgi:hypothetical protein